MKNITISPTVPLEDTATIDNHVSANVDTSFPFQQEKKEIHEAVQHRGGRLAY
jgi:hypothetical protein